MIIFSWIKSIFSFIQTYFKTVVFLTILAFILSSNEEETSLQTANLMQINVTGKIVDASSYMDLFEKASKDNIKGVLINVNSPGGAVPPSIEIAYMIKELKKSKPVIAYASGTMASGSYYASIYADWIIANPGSIVGSIGVYMITADASKLLEKVGIKPAFIQAGKYKLVGMPTRESFSYEKELLQDVTDDVYNLFVSDVAKARNLDPKKHKVFADGKIFLAHKAKQIGLIDEVATILRARELLIKKSKIVKPIWYKKDKFEEMLERLDASFNKNILSSLASNFFILN
jgi:protease-4